MECSRDIVVERRAASANQLLPRNVSGPTPLANCDFGVQDAYLVGPPEAGDARFDFIGDMRNDLNVFPGIRRGVRG